jgi:hypothetical protein
MTAATPRTKAAGREGVLAGVHRAALDDRGLILTQIPLGWRMSDLPFGEASSRCSSCTSRSGSPSSR